VVSRGAALRCVGGRVSPEKLPTLSPLLRIFVSHAVQVGLQNSSSIFMEIMREAEVMEFLGK
jgi:hypothetical protein